MMRKNINFKYLVIILFIILLIIFMFIKLSKNVSQDVSKNHFGYFESVATLNYNHPDADVINLSDNKILILGNDIKGIPSEIYDPESNEVKYFIFKDNLFISQRGLALNDHKILLINTCNPIISKCNINTFYDFKNNITVYDLKSKKIVNNYTFKNFDNLIIEDYLCLEDGNVFFILSNHQIKQEAEYYFLLYDIQKNNINILQKLPKLYRPKGIRINNDEILIFQDNSTILKYNIKKNTLISTNSKTALFNCSYTKIGNKVLILGTIDSNNNKFNQLYDIDQDKIIDTPPMQFDRTYAELNTSGKTRYRTVPINSHQILITGGRRNPKSYFGYRGIDIDSAEIYDINTNAFKTIDKSIYTHDSSELIKLDNNNILLIGGTTNKAGGIEIFQVKEKGERYEY